MQLIRPFGPTIGLAKVPNNIMSMLLDVTDRVLNDISLQDSIQFSFADQLSRTYPLKKQFKITNLIPKEVYSWAQFEILNYYKYTAETIGLSALEEQSKDNILIPHWWFNSMGTQEDLPPHSHHGDISCILYCKIPEDSLPHDGLISFINSSVPDNLELPLIQLRPEEATLLIFPSRLMHSVTSIHTEKERRSISFNSFFINNKRTPHDVER